jgi:type II secretory pathway pseudopilin PulG
MSKKSIRYDGFILLESLLSLTIICFVIANLSLASIHLLKQTADSQEHLKMQRYAYESIKEYELYGGDTYREIHDGPDAYRVYIEATEQDVLKVIVTSGKDTFIVEK